MTSQWTDERLDRFANKVDDFIESSRDREIRLDERMNRQGERIDNLIGQIGGLIEALYLELPNIKAEINSIGEEAREQRETLHAELVEIKEITRQQAITADQYALAAQTQAENIRQLIAMLNQKQA
jgi:hypothetical protein